MVNRRQWVRMAIVGACGVASWAAGKEFWESKDAASWSAAEKEVVLGQSPWAQQGVVRIEAEKKRPTAGYGNNGRIGVDVPDTRPGVPVGGVKSVPIGEEVPKVPKADSGPQVEFPVLARWDSARPVRLAGGPALPEVSGDFYVIRLRGLPLMPPPKVKPGEVATNPNEGLLAAVKAGSRLERNNKAGIPCAHLFTGSGDTSGEVLLLFPRGADPITVGDKVVTLESRFAAFHLSIKFRLKDMLYKGALAL